MWLNPGVSKISLLDEIMRNRFYFAPLTYSDDEPEAAVLDSAHNAGALDENLSKELWLEPAKYWMDVLGSHRKHQSLCFACFDLF